jgi:hypothetical protein
MTDAQIMQAIPYLDQAPSPARMVTDLYEIFYDNTGSGLTKQRRGEVRALLDGLSTKHRHGTDEPADRLTGERLGASIIRVMKGIASDADESCLMDFMRSHQDKQLCYPLPLSFIMKHAAAIATSSPRIHVDACAVYDITPSDMPQSPIPEFMGLIDVGHDHGCIIYVSGKAVAAGSDVMVRMAMDYAASQRGGTKILDGILADIHKACTAKGGCRLSPSVAMDVMTAIGKSVMIKRHGHRMPAIVAWCRRQDPGIMVRPWMIAEPSMPEAIVGCFPPGKSIPYITESIQKSQERGASCPPSFANTLFQKMPSSMTGIHRQILRWIGQSVKNDLSIHGEWYEAIRDAQKKHGYMTPASTVIASVTCPDGDLSWITPDLMRTDTGLIHGRPAEDGRIQCQDLIRRHGAVDNEMLMLCAPLARSRPDTCMALFSTLYVLEEGHVIEPESRGNRMLMDRILTNLDRSGPVITMPMPSSSLLAHIAQNSSYRFMMDDFQGQEDDENLSQHATDIMRRIRVYPDTVPVNSATAWALAKERIEVLHAMQSLDGKSQHPLAP